MIVLKILYVLVAIVVIYKACALWGRVCMFFVSRNIMGIGIVVNLILCLAIIAYLAKL